ncbi:hypothetical protein [Ligilactobacillus hohenheimensis]|uniref:hypothetical protein n=1 Tax=Ligilactobacillus hohenheimensis TaxID=2991832 RepID=UPI0024B8C04C|nr:hypothetical protein [Ligilactobacillus hohenheimensis]
MDAFNNFINQFPEYNPADLAALSINPSKNRDTEKLEKESLKEVLNNPAVQGALKLLADK